MPVKMRAFFIFPIANKGKPWYNIYAVKQTA